MHTDKQNIIDLLLKQPQDEQVEDYSFTHQKCLAMRPFLQPLIQNNDTTIMIPVELMPFGVQEYAGQEGIFNHVYKRQGGGDVYTYLTVKLQKTKDSNIVIKEELPDKLYYFLGEYEILPKKNCAEWLETYPCILQALVDECFAKKIVGIQFTILEIRFHPVDYRPMAYYTCTKKLLAKVNNS